MGDLVSVTNPEFVTRVGYPMSFQMAYDHIKKNHLADIENFIDTKILKLSTVRSDIYFGDRDQKVDRNMHKVISSLAHVYVKANGFGGKERKIYTKTYSDLQGKVYQVVEKKVVKTGIYYPPWSGQNYEGEWDGEPGGLDKEQTHVLLYLNSWYHNRLEEHEYPYDTYLVIERCNVLLMPKDTEHVGQILPLRGKR